MASAIFAAAPIAFAGCQSAKVEDAKDAAATASASSVARLDAEKHAAAGKQFAAAGDNKRAVEEFTAALDQLRPAEVRVEEAAPDVDVLFQRGVAWLELGFPDTAAEDFTEVIRHDRDKGAAFAKRGEAYVAMGDFYRAVRDCTQAMRFEPTNADAYRFRGLAYLRRGQYDRATTDLEQAIALNEGFREELAPTVADAYYAWSKQLASAGNGDLATVKLTKAREYNPALAVEPDVAAPAGPASPEKPSARTVAKPVLDEAVEHFNLASDLEAQKHYDEAIMEFTEALALDREYLDAYIRRAETLIAAGFPDTARKGSGRSAPPRRALGRRLSPAGACV